MLCFQQPAVRILLCADTSLALGMAKNSVLQGFCHFERSEKSTQIKRKFTILGYFAFLRKLSMTMQDKYSIALNTTKVK